MWSTLLTYQSQQDRHASVRCSGITTLYLLTLLAPIGESQMLKGVCVWKNRKAAWWSETKTHLGQRLTKVNPYSTESLRFLQLWHKHVGFDWSVWYWICSLMRIHSMPCGLLPETNSLSVRNRMHEQKQTCIKCGNTCEYVMYLYVYLYVFIRIYTYLSFIHWKI